MYGIERSAIADQATLIVKDNGYSDRVTIIKGEQSLGTPTFDADVRCCSN